MLNQIQISYPEISNVIYIIIRDKIGNVWNITEEAFEVWNDSNLSDYVKNSTYKGGNLYIVEFPDTIIRGYYTIQIFIRSGVVPASTDLLLDSVIGYWDDDANNLLPVRTDALIEYDATNGERFTAKALSADSGGQIVNVDHYNEETVIEVQGGSNPSLTAEGSYS